MKLLRMGARNLSKSVIEVPYFDGRPLLFHESLGDIPPEGQHALAAFLHLTNEQRLSESACVYEYYRDFRGVGSFAKWLDKKFGILSNDETIWSRVAMNYLDVRQGMTGLWYVVASGDCDWDQEHGVMMAWPEGTKLVRVGPDDGDLGERIEGEESEETSVIFL
jgi:hypothetical protein